MLERTSITLFCTIIGFFVGIGCMYTATQQVLEAQARRLASLTNAGLTAEAECNKELIKLIKGRK